MDVAVSAVSNSRALLGESPVWDAAHQCLYWVDISRHEIRRYRDGAGEQCLATLDVPVGAIAPRRCGGLIAAAGLGFATVDYDGTVRWIASVGSGDRMNDGACDPAGRFLAGTMNRDRSPGAALYRLDPDGTVTTLLPGVAISNGLGWSPGGDLLYYIDTPARRVDVFDYDVATGTPSARRLFADVRDAPGNPDGLTVDADGGVWVVMCRAGTVRRYTKAGQLDGILALPVSRPTSCAFGGPALDTLYLTSGQMDMSVADLAAEPLAGALLFARPGVTGLACPAFAG
jgi:sugar lactone lactonase YvrE